VKIIVPCNNKGGVGKTCVSAILADYASNILKKKTLVIDLDPQCNISQRYLEMEIDPNNKDGHQPPIHIDFNKEEDDDWNGRSSIADIFLNPKNGVVPYPTINKNLDIMPAHAEHLLLVEQCERNEVLEKIYNRFDSFLSSEDIKAEYDYVVIDTAPSKGPLTRSAMRAASDIIIPTQMEDKPIRGVFGMIQLWEQERMMRKQANPLNLIGILPNMYDQRTALHKGMFESIKAMEHIGKYLIPTKLSRRITFAENDTEQAAPKSIFNLPSSNKARQECVEMCEYVFNNIKQAHEQTGMETH
jgi:chromosome partitioning protein